MPKNPPHVSGRDATPGRLRGMAPEVVGTLLAEARLDSAAGTRGPAALTAGWDLVLDDRAGVAEGAELSATGADGLDGADAFGGLGSLDGLDDLDDLDGPEMPGGSARHSWWYVRRFALPAGAAAGLLLDVEGVGHDAEFWLDGRRVGALPHPFARAEFDVTEAAGVAGLAAAAADAGGARIAAGTSSAAGTSGADSGTLPSGGVVTDSGVLADGLRPRTLAVRVAPEPHLAGACGQAAPGALRCPDAAAGPAGRASARAVAAVLAPRVRVRVRVRPPASPAGARGATAYREPATLAAPGLGVRGWWPGEAGGWQAEQREGAGLPEAFVRAVEERLGAATSAAAFLRRARIVDFESLRAAVEAAATRPPRRSAASEGAAEWTDPVPEDVTGWTDAGRCGARAALARLHVQADPRDGSVVVVNREPFALRGATVTASLYDLAGRPLAAPVTAAADVPASGVVRVLAVPFRRALPAAHLLRLTLTGPDGVPVAANDYWRHRTPTDLRSLGGLPFVALSLRTAAAGRSAVTAVVTNTGAWPAAWVRVAVRGHETALDRAAPDFAVSDSAVSDSAVSHSAVSDSAASGSAAREAAAPDSAHFPCLLPGESREVTLGSGAGAADSGAAGGVQVVAEAYNALAVRAC